MRCRRCQRPLRAERSVSRQIGPSCARRERMAAALCGNEKAAEIIELGAAIRIPRRKDATPVYRVVSSDGSRYYLTAPGGCNCPGGLHGLYCYHRIAIRALCAA